MPLLLTCAAERRGECDWTRGLSGQVAQPAASTRGQVLLRGDELPDGTPAPLAEQSLVAGFSVSFRSEPQLPVLCGVLHTAYSLFHYYTDESRTNELLAEIVLVVSQFAAPFTALLEVRARARAVACYGGVRLR